MEYRVAAEYGAPRYYDIESGDMLYESGDDGLMSYWVVLYDPQEKYVEEFIDNFPNEKQAKEFMAKLIAEGDNYGSEV